MLIRSDNLTALSKEVQSFDLAELKWDVWYSLGVGKAFLDIWLYDDKTCMVSRTNVDNLPESGLKEYVEDLAVSLNESWDGR